MIAFIKAVPLFLLGMKELALVAWEVAKLVRAWYERQERAKVLKELRVSIKESRETLDNSRLVKLLDPNVEPYPRKKNETPSS